MKHISFRQILGALGATLFSGIVAAPHVKAAPECKECGVVQHDYAYGCYAKSENCSDNPFRHNFVDRVQYEFRNCAGGRDNGNITAGPNPYFTNGAQGCCNGSYTAASQIPSDTCY